MARLMALVDLAAAQARRSATTSARRYGDAYDHAVSERDQRLLDDLQGALRRYTQAIRVVLPDGLR